MLNRLTIKNFKSVKELDIDCNRINLFIGEPNAGKSNILEALGLLSAIGAGDIFQQYVRFREFFNIFYDNITDNPIHISGDINHSLFDLSITAKDVFDVSCKYDDKLAKISDLNAYGQGASGKLDLFKSIKYYKYNGILDRFPYLSYPSLTTPDGQNLYTILARNKTIRDNIKSIFKNFGYRLRLKTKDQTIEAQKEGEDMDFDYPYALLSDTLKRVVFYFIAIESNTESTLVFEEPESHSFPYYTKLLGEKIGYDNNQFFIATHNPYLIKAILEKTNKGEANVFVTYFENYQTKVKRLNEGQLTEFMDIDPFLNLHNFY